QARQAADAAVRRLPERALGYVLRGLAAGQGGDLAPAIADFEAALERDPASLDEPLDGARAAELLARGGRHDLAARVLGRVLGRMREGGGRRSLYALYGDVLLTLGPARLSDAVRAYREALRTAAHDPRAGIGLALALRRQAAATDGAGDEWRVLARRVAARGRLDALLNSIDVPESERAARRAVALEASGDRAAARNAWLQAEHGPWAAQAHAAAEALE
ncbi:MAG: hypothetical protein CMH59_19355, partial [Myxococcales bacterium]|nr:hypothetical protein [Myxococcales bacterium]